VQAAIHALLDENNLKTEVSGRHPLHLFLRLLSTNRSKFVQEMKPAALPPNTKMEAPAQMARVRHRDNRVEDSNDNATLGRRAFHDYLGQRVIIWSAPARCRIPSFDSFEAILATTSVAARSDILESVRVLVNEWV